MLQAATYGGLALTLGRSPFGTRLSEPAGGASVTPAPEILWRADPSVATVYLTVDDWFDREMVETVLDIAAREQVRLTFFPIGRMAVANADLVRRAARDGHEIENHTWDHQRLDLGHFPIAQIPGEIHRQFAAVQQILGPSYRQYFLRPPGGFGIFGQVNPWLVRYAEEAGLRIAMWSTDSSGWKFGYRTDPAAVDATLANVLPGLVAGGIVLQHAIPDDVLALPTEIRIARERGLRMSTLAEGILGGPTPALGPGPVPMRPERNPGS